MPSFGQSIRGSFEERSGDIADVECGRRVRVLLIVLAWLARNG
jgi:hypothetical protein